MGDVGESGVHVGLVKGRGISAKSEAGEKWTVVLTAGLNNLMV